MYVALFWENYKNMQFYFQITDRIYKANSMVINFKTHVLSSQLVFNYF